MSSPSGDTGDSRLLTTVWIYAVVALAGAARLLWLVLDAFNLNRFLKEGTPAGRDVEQRVRRHDFQAIVVRGDRSDAGERNDLERLIDENDQIRGRRPPFVILVPRD